MLSHHQPVNGCTNTCCEGDFAAELARGCSPYIIALDLRIPGHFFAKSCEKSGQSAMEKLSYLHQTARQQPQKENLWSCHPCTPLARIQLASKSIIGNALASSAKGHCCVMKSKQSRHPSTCKSRADDYGHCRCVSHGNPRVAEQA